jgi:mRNA-degrading endonuclease YafQ of YafQ-DinJ toxin-antitoxin module
VKRRLLRTSAFVRAARRTVKKDPGLASDLAEALAALEQDAFHSSLRTHKLKDKLEGSWACSAGYDLRIVFRFVADGNAEVVLLLTMGSHDEVY